MEHKLRERIELDLEFDDNDASSVINGFEFQIMSSIPLVLLDIKRINRFVIEGKYNDIEIYYNDDSMAFIQAKAIQTENSENNSVKNERFISAVTSLYKTPFMQNEKLIYVSNFKSPVGDDGALFANNIVTYRDCPPSIKATIDELIVKASDRLNKTLEEKKDKDVHVKTKTINKITKLINRLREDSNKLNLCFYSIYPITENKNINYRMKPIRESIITFLSSEISFEYDKALSLSAGLLMYWHGYLTSEATISNKSSQKEISKLDFLWPIVVYSSSFHKDVVKDMMSGRILETDAIDAEQYLDESVFVNLQMFDFLHKLYKDFNDFRRNTATAKPEIDFINEKWSDYKDKFIEFPINESQLEYVIKNYLYRLLLDYNNAMKLDRGAKIW